MFVCTGPRRHHTAAGCHSRRTRRFSELHQNQLVLVGKNPQAVFQAEEVHHQATCRWLGETVCITVLDKYEVPYMHRCSIVPVSDYWKGSNQNVVFSIQDSYVQERPGSDHCCM